MALYCQAALFFALFACVYAHTKMTAVVYNGQSNANCLRPTYPDFVSATNMGAQWPISQSEAAFYNGITSNNYTCGFLPVNGFQPAPSKCSIPAGATVGVSYYHGANADEDANRDKYIHYSHKGPFMVYLAKSDTGSGNVWFKIHQAAKTQESSNFNNVLWASTDLMRQGQGILYFTIPSDIAPGNYLLRTEVIALHDTSSHGAQPYVRCAELTITGGGTANPVGVALPGAVQYSDPGLTYNIYNQYTTPYPFPGPAVYTAGSGGAPNPGGVDGGSLNPCDDLSACVAMCGEGNVQTCSCENGNPTIECASSDASLVAIGSIFVSTLAFLAL